MANTTTDEVVAAFTGAVRSTLAKSLEKIEHCAGQLTQEQLWWRPRPEMNSIANLILHLAGSLRQWAVTGVSGTTDTRSRPQEFSDRSNRPKEELLAILRRVFQEADAQLASLTAEIVVTRRRIQGYDVDVASAVMSTACHVRGHVQEIIHMTREQLGERYRFDFIPQGPEQESAGGKAL
jgi:Protein of unknown function (DUF1572)